MIFKVDSRKSWQPVQSEKTRFFLKPDDEINIYYLHGDWVYTPGYGRFTVDGDSNREAPAHYPLPNGNIGALVGRWVDEKLKPISDPIIKEPIFLVGKNFNYKNISKKTLYLDLVINDDLTGEYGAALEDNDGTITVEIQIGSLPYFYKEKRNEIISTLYDPAFALMEGKPGWIWTDNDERAHIKFDALRTEITSQSGYYDNPWEAQYFNLVIDEIKATKLFGFLQGLPKGAVLHLHPGAMGDYKDLLKQASEFSGDTCQVRFSYNKNRKINKDPDSFQWQSKPNADPCKNPRLGGYMNLSDALKSNQQAVYDLLILSPNAMDYPEDMWDLFQPVFSRVGVLLQKLEIATKYYDDAIEYLAKKENLSHVEIRSYWDADNEQKPETRENIIVNAASKAKVSLKVIHSLARTFDMKQPDSIKGKRDSILEEVVKTGKSIQKGESQFLCGFDLFAEEDKGATTAFLTNDFHTAFHELNNYLPPLFFHDGESNLAPSYDPHNSENLATPSTAYFNNNLVDALLFQQLFNTKKWDAYQKKYIVNTEAPIIRVGHGLALFKSSQLLQKYIDAKIAVELCPISNQLLRYVKDIREHPGQAYLAAGLPVSINSDDPAIYGYQGISFDFWEAVIAWGLDLQMVKVLCFNSLMYSALSEPEKTAKISEWNKRWDAYITKFIN